MVGLCKYSHNYTSTLNIYVHVHTCLYIRRLILTCVSNEEVRPHWLAEIRRDGSVRQSLMFIMRSSVNGECIQLHFVAVLWSGVHVM